MASTTVKSTFSLDIETRRLLDHLAETWNVSRSEALRRAIRQSAGVVSANDRMAALEALQKQARMTRETVEDWAQSVRAERRAAKTRSARGNDPH